MNNLAVEAPGSVAPGDESESFLSGFTAYGTGLLLALGLTAVSFWVGHTHVFWGPGVPVVLVVLAIAQMGVHLVFFLHINTGPNSSNNVLALAFGLGHRFSHRSGIAVDHGEPQPHDALDAADNEHAALAHESHWFL